MIFDQIGHWERYRGLEDLHRALCYLRGAGELGGRLSASPVLLRSRPPEQCRYEAHRRYADVHFILSGVEGVAVQRVEALTPVEAFSEEKDIGFYTGPAAWSGFLRAGDFLVCWPGEAHRIGMMEDAPADIRKLVVKIEV